MFVLINLMWGLVLKAAVFLHLQTNIIDSLGFYEDLSSQKSKIINNNNGDIQQQW